jgi:hypothetical protein
LHHDEAGGVEFDAFDTTLGTVKVVSNDCGFWIFVHPGRPGEVTRGIAKSYEARELATGG